DADADARRNGRTHAAGEAVAQGFQGRERQRLAPRCRREGAIEIDLRGGENAVKARLVAEFQLSRAVETHGALLRPVLEFDGLEQSRSRGGFDPAGEAPGIAGERLSVWQREARGPREGHRAFKTGGRSVE